MEKVHAVVARSTFAVKSVKARQVRGTFGSSDVEKARRCGAKRVCKWKCAKHTLFGALVVELAMWKKCALLWRKAHLEVKMYKAPAARTTFGSSDGEKVHGVVARSTFGRRETPEK